MLKFIFSLNLKIFNLFLEDLNFEGFLLLDSLSKNNYKFKILNFNLDIYCIEIFFKNQKIIIKNLFNFIKVSKNNLCKYFNLKKINKLPKLYLKLDKDKNIFIKLNRKNSFFKKGYKYDKIILRFVKHELKILLQIFLNFEKFLLLININIINQNVYTISGLSYNYFYKKCNNFNISKNIKENVDLYVRSSYFGGRCEVFGNPDNDKNIYYVDYKGMYNQCMLEKFPVGEGSFLWDLKEINKIGFYDITYLSNDLEIPILPHKNNIDNKLMFTNGENRGIFWHEEINLFLKSGGVLIKIHSAYVFEQNDFVFTKFLQNLNSIKNNNLNYYKIVKNVVNSLYGRLGMKKQKTSTLITKNESLLKDKKFLKTIVNVSTLNDYIIINYNKDLIKINENNFNSFDHNYNSNNVIYASIIASKARIKLYNTIIYLKTLGAKILYCDTDSVYYEHNNEIFIENTTKSAFKIKDAVFVSPKSYCIKYFNLQEKIVLKGFSTKKIKFNNIKTNFYKNKNIKIQIVIKKKSNFKLQILKKNYILRLENYNKRIFNKSKKNTTPYLYKKGVYI